MDLEAQMTEKVQQLGAARHALRHLEEQRSGLQTHILRLEGAITMLRELGVQLPENVVETPNHPSAPKPAEEQPNAAE